MTPLEPFTSHTMMNCKHHWYLSLPDLLSVAQADKTLFQAYPHLPTKVRSPLVGFVSLKPRCDNWYNFLFQYLWTFKLQVSEIRESQHYKMNNPRQVVVVLNRDISFIVLAISLLYRFMSVPSSPPRLISRCKHTYKFSYYKTFG